jgi:hypothetical protein
MSEVLLKIEISDDGIERVICPSDPPRKEMKSLRLYKRIRSHLNAIDKSLSMKRKAKGA